jgi:biopolymer transport protein ExbD
VINAQGQLVINRIAMPFTTVEAVADALKKAAASQKDPVVVISADAKTTHQSVIRVMEASRLAGLSQITFTTQSNK